MFGFPHGRRKGGALPNAPVTLFPLQLTANSIAENSAAGVGVGGILGKTSGSAIALSDDAGGRFAISGTNVVAGATATDYETATFHDITIVETLAGAVGSPKSTTIRVFVTDVVEGAAIVTAPTLAGRAIVGQRLFAAAGTYSASPVSVVTHWEYEDATLPTISTLRLSSVSLAISARARPSIRVL
jgi:hypothetical protein